MKDHNYLTGLFAGQSFVSRYGGVALNAELLTLDTNKLANNEVRTTSVENNVLV